MSMRTLAMRLRELIARRLMPESQCIASRFKKIFDALEEISIIEKEAFLTNGDVVNLSIIASEINIALLGFDSTRSLFEKEKILDRVEELVNELNAFYKSIKLRTVLSFVAPLPLTIFLGLLVLLTNFTIAGVIYVFGGFSALMMFSKNILRGLTANMLVGVAGILALYVSAPKIPEGVAYFTAGLFITLMDALYIFMAFLASSPSYIQRMHERVAKVVWEVVSHFFGNEIESIEGNDDLEKYRRFISIINRAKDSQANY